MPRGSIITGAVSGPDEPVTMVDGSRVIQGAAKGWGMVFTYFYVLYFAVLLIHRERRDDLACTDTEKYGEDWEKYKKIVRWRILPFVY